MLKTRTKTRWQWLLLVIFSLAFLSCNEAEEKIATKLQKEHQMSEYESQTGAAHLIRYAITKKDGGKLKIQRDKDGGSYFPIDYAAVKDKEKIKFLADKAEDYRECLENSRGWNLHFAFFEKQGVDLRSSFKEKMILCQWWQGRFEERQKNIEFKRLLSGDQSIKIDEKWLVDACAIYPLAEPKENITFKPDYVLEAKESKELERIELTWDLQREVENPDYPNIDPVKKKIWKAEKYCLRILAFDISPFDRKPDYVEVYRIDKEGNQEEHPIISVFHVDGEQNLSLAVIDLDQKGEIGFGIPDIFETVDISKGSDLLNSYSELLDKTLLGKERVKKNFQEKSCREIYLVQPGDVGPVAEINPNGWIVPFEYKFKKSGRVRNFTPLVKFEGPNGNCKELGDPPYILEHIALQYHARDSRDDDVRGRVVEFYKPSADLNNKRITEIKIRDDNLLEFVFEHGSVVVMTSEKAIGKLFRIDYDYDSKRAAIEDKDDDGKLESKTIINKPTDLKLVNHAKH